MKQASVFVRLAALLTFFVTACSQVPVALEPQRRTAQNDAALYATVTPGGLYVGSVSGDGAFDGASSSALLEKFSRSGRQPWFRQIAPRPGDDSAELNAVERDPAATSMRSTPRSGRFSGRNPTSASRPASSAATGRTAGSPGRAT